MQSALLEHPEAKNNTNQKKFLPEWVFVRLEQEDLLPMIIPYAQAIAFGLDRRLRLIEILEQDRTAVRPPDPVEWDLRRREAQLHLEKLASHYADDRCSIDTRVLERFVPEEVDSCIAKSKPILGFGRHNGQLPWQLDAANRRFLEDHCSSVLMVPDEVATTTHVSFSKIMVPLDGSSRAELALPLALDMAKRHGAQVFIVHAAPEAVLTESGPLEAEALELMHRVKARNRRVASEFLLKIRSRFASMDVVVDTHIVEGGDIRRRLIELARTQLVDLIVLASHGEGGHGDVLSGSVATFILEHASIPVLMVGTEFESGNQHLFANTVTKGTRKPAVTAGNR